MKKLAAAPLVSKVYHPLFTAERKIQRSSVVERSAVNRLVVGSSPTAGANFRRECLANVAQLDHHTSTASPGGVNVAQRSAILRFANLRSTNPQKLILGPLVLSVAVQMLRTITLWPSAMISSTFMCKSGQRSYAASIMRIRRKKIVHTGFAYFCRANRTHHGYARKSISRPRPRDLAARYICHAATASWNASPTPP